MLSYREQVESGEKFFMIARSERSRLGNFSKFLIKQKVVANVVVELGKLAESYISLLEPCLHIIKHINNAASDKDFWGQLFEKAGGIMQGQFYDLERKGSPGGYRESELSRNYTLREKVALLLCLERLRSKYTMRGPISDGSAIMKLARGMGVAKSTTPPNFQ